MKPIFIILIIVAGIAAIGLPICIAAWIIRTAKRFPRRTQEELGEEKGKRGETYIASVLKSCMQEGDTLLNNVILSNPRTKASFEIDHILLSRRGIFVVETKNRSGDIYGDDETETWVQILGDGSIRHEFYSPVQQSVAHAKKVCSVTGCRAVFPVVVFAQGNTQFIRSDITFDPAGLHSYVCRQRDILNERELSAALQNLRACMAHSISAAEHTRNVRQKYGN